MPDISTLIHALPARVNGDASLVRSGRFCSTQFMLAAGDAEFHLEVERGRLMDVVDGPLRMRPWRFALRADAESWLRFWAPLPAVGFNDIFAMVRYGHARIDGDIGPMLESLRYIKDVVALPRRMLQAQSR